MKNLFQDLGFYVHDEKSVMEPTRKLEFLGFILNSSKMQIYPTQQKIEKLQELARPLKEGNKKVKIRTVAKMTGIMVSNTIVNEYGNNYYRRL